MKAKNRQSKSGVVSTESLPVTERPLAAPVLTSYRHKSKVGWVMIGAKDDADALSEASRSLDGEQAERSKLQKWNGSTYEPVPMEEPSPECAHPTGIRKSAKAKPHYEMNPVLQQAQAKAIDAAGVADKSGTSEDCWAASQAHYKAQFAAEQIKAMGAAKWHEEQSARYLALSSAAHKREVGA